MLKCSKCNDDVDEDDAYVEKLNTTRFKLYHEKCVSFNKTVIKLSKTSFRLLDAIFGTPPHDDQHTRR